MKPTTLSDGTRIPAGSLVVTPSIPTHFDEEHYEDPEVFNPWRFSDMRGDDSEAGVKQFVGTSPEYIAWGFGRHSWCVYVFHTFVHVGSHLLVVQGDSLPLPN